jgi:hypothetical protein
MLTNYVYLLQEREFIKTNEKIYKIGMTTKPNHTRFNQYPKGSILLFQIICNDCCSLEKQILSNFKSKFILRKDIGNEYFEGNFTEMIFIISDVVIKSYQIHDDTVTQSDNIHDDTVTQSDKIPDDTVTQSDKIPDDTVTYAMTIQNYQCSVCDKRFATKDSYNRHINNPKVHIKYQENVKIYICNCGKMYLHRQSLRTHKKQCNQNKN